MGSNVACWPNSRCVSPGCGDIRGNIGNPEGAKCGHCFRAVKFLNMKLQGRWLCVTYVAHDPRVGFHRTSQSGFVVWTDRQVTAASNRSTLEVYGDYHALRWMLGRNMSVPVKEPTDVMIELSMSQPRFHILTRSSITLDRMTMERLRTKWHSLSLYFLHSLACW